MLVFTTAKGVEGIAGGKLTLGADASVAAGPVGRTASAATDPNFKAEVYSYSRSKRHFRGHRPGWHRHYHQRRRQRGVLQEARRRRSEEIISGAVTSNDSAAQRFLAAVATSTGVQRTAAVGPPRRNRR